MCSFCNYFEPYVLRCIKDDCGFVLGVKCATLPQVVKHVTYEHPVSLCYGGEKEEASDKFWCDICEKETNPTYWFYTCKDQLASLHTKCVLGEFSGLMPRSVANFWDKSFEVVLNNSTATRPICSPCKSRCIYPIILKVLGTSGTYICSMHCAALLDR